MAPCCTHRVNQGELSQCCFHYDDSTINIVLVLLLLLLLILLLHYKKPHAFSWPVLSMETVLARRPVSVLNDKLHVQTFEKKQSGAKWTGHTTVRGLTCNNTQTSLMCIGNVGNQHVRQYSTHLAFLATKNVIALPYTSNDYNLPWTAGLRLAVCGQSIPSSSASLSETNERKLWTVQTSHFYDCFCITVHSSEP